jgi:hypothetical protein
MLTVPQQAALGSSVSEPWSQDVDAVSLRVPGGRGEVRRWEGAYLGSFRAGFLVREKGRGVVLLELGCWV